jgi:pimeloyl-ACP methyl ester carboxylesterase
MPLIKSGDISLEYYIDGSGPRLLLIQGLGGHSFSCGEPLVENLARDFEVIRFTNSGLGKSERTEGKASIKGMADDAVRLLDALGIDKAHVFGISMGGMIGQEVALNYPERVLTLTLGCTAAGQKYAPFLPDEDVRALTDMSGTVEERARRAWPYVLGTAGLDNPIAREAVERELRYTLENPTPDEVFYQHIAAVFEHDTYERLPGIATPTLIIHGEADRLVNPGHAEVLHERIPGSRLQWLPSLGHLFFVERPDEVAGLIRDFITAARPVAA